MVERPARQRERGIALLAALLAIALMTIIVVDFTSVSAFDYISAANQANALRAEYLARSAVNVGLALLAQDARADAVARHPYDALTDVWAAPFPPIELGAGSVTLYIEDETRKFSLNQLLAPNGRVNNVAVERLTVLFNLLNVPPEITPAIIDWLDSDGVDTPGGAEADYYLRLVPPYEPRNGLMPTIGDLRMVRGVDDAIFARLRNYLTAAPEPLVNANTAPPEVLACLEPEFAANPRLVKSIIEARTARPFATVLDVANLPGLGAISPRLSQVLTTRSNYFTISGLGTYARARKLVFATFRRNPDGSELLVSWQED